MTDKPVSWQAFCGAETRAWPAAIRAVALTAHGRADSKGDGDRPTVEMRVDGNGAVTTLAEHITSQELKAGRQMRQPGPYVGEFEKGDGYIGDPDEESFANMAVVVRAVQAGACIQLGQVRSSVPRSYGRSGSPKATGTTI